MAQPQSPGEIRRVAKLLDDAVENSDMSTVLSCFAEECETELPGTVLYGKAGVRKALDWLYRNLYRASVHDPLTHFLHLCQLATEAGLDHLNGRFFDRLVPASRVKPETVERVCIENDHIRDGFRSYSYGTTSLRKLTSRFDSWRIFLHCLAYHQDPGALETVDDARDRASGTIAPSSFRQ